MNAAPLGWLGIVRLGLVQTALGAIFVLLTSTINRVMVVEMALPAFIPGLLMGWHYVMQGLRPRWGYNSDVGGRRTPWIITGMAVLATGGVLAAVATALIETSFAGGIALAIVAFSLVEVGVGAAGTNLLALLATRVAPGRRAAAATIVWVMMIAGFAITAPTAGHFLDPFTPLRLVTVTGVVSVVALIVAILAVRGVERGTPAPQASAAQAEKPAFAAVMAEVWAEPQARLFTIFVFVSMLAYSAQDLILEPYAGIVFGMTLGATTKLAGLQHGGVLAGMICVSLITTFIGGPRLGSLRGWAIAGCIGSALALVAVAMGGLVGPSYPLKSAVFALGFTNGAFATAAIGSMMALAGAGANGREGTRMGLWGAAQAVAFGVGGLAGAVAVDIAKAVIGSPVSAYAAVFIGEAILFLVSAVVAGRVGALAKGSPRRSAPQPSFTTGQGALTS